MSFICVWFVGCVVLSNSFYPLLYEDEMWSVGEESLCGECLMQFLVSS